MPEVTATKGVGDRFMLMLEIAKNEINNAAAPALKSIS